MTDQSTSRAGSPREEALREAPRLLSMQDREPGSKTYGCFDRTFWGWKFSDFPGARFQEGVYSLAHLYSRPFPGNTFAGREQLLSWAAAGLDFWARIQYRDGSFDEAYPFEHSLAATAFTGFYLGEAWLLLDGKLPGPVRERVLRAFAKAGDWLSDNDEHHGVLSNHLAVAAAALHVLSRVTGQDRYDRRCRHFLDRIYAHQSREGWYEEYGGADPGYQTHGTFYLARLWQHTKDAALLESLTRSVAFLKHFIHPNGTLGGEYGSRNTEFYFPAGFEMLAPVCPDAAAIARFMDGALRERRPAGLPAMDPYNFFPMLNNYLFAGEHRAPEGLGDAPLPCEQTGRWEFPDAGLLVRSSPSYYAVVGLSKGGVVKAYDRARKRLALSDCGYWARFADGRVASSQNLVRPASWTQQGDEIRQECDFFQVNQRMPAPFLFVGFRMFSLTLGRMKSAALWLKQLLVKVLIRKRKQFPLRLRRRIVLAEDRVEIVDELQRIGDAAVEELRSGSKFSSIHMGSSRYFQAQEIDEPPAERSLDLQGWSAQGVLSNRRAVAFGERPGGGTP